MATTTNFGWETPDDTDLVKDGAAAIRTALGGVDTSFVDLKGGTTGQVLAKASNTDLDYSWVTDATGIPATIFDAKGDIIAASAADTAARLAVGANDTVLTADSTTATGLKWGTVSAGGMTLLSTTTLSGASTAINSISQSYNELQILVTGVTSTSESSLEINPRNGTTTLPTVYLFGDSTTLQLFSTTRMNDGTTGSGTRINPTGGKNSFMVKISNYASTASMKPVSYFGQYEDVNEVQSPTFGSGGVTSNSAVDSILIKFGTGETLNSGTVKIYGVK